jgi:lipopolysaccharide/colanic/teichoic acid biosynthesis glycosyltransferase
MLKRAFDIIFALIFLILLIPLFLIIAIFISIDSRGSIFFKQTRVGKNGKKFTLYKFRSMYNFKSNNMLITVNNDERITRVGKFIRKTKLDELPQLFNILKGDMSFVGPRPEVPKYVELYTPQQRKVLTVRPGLTDYASLKFINESELLTYADNPEEYYIKVIMPKKIEYSLEYIKKQNFYTDIVILLKTFLKLFRICKTK